MHYKSAKFKKYFYLNDCEKITKYLNRHDFNYKYRDKSNKSILVFFTEMYNRRIYLKNKRFRRLIKNYIIEWLKTKRFDLKEKILGKRVVLFNKRTEGEYTTRIKYSYLHIPKSIEFFKYIDLKNDSRGVFTYYRGVFFWEFYMKMIKNNKMKISYAKFLLRWMFENHKLGIIYDVLMYHLFKYSNGIIYADERMFLNKIIKYLYNNKDIYEYLYINILGIRKNLLFFKNLFNNMVNTFFNSYFEKFIEEQYGMPSIKLCRQIISNGLDIDSDCELEYEEDEYKSIKNF